MKHISIFLVVLLFMAACKKERPQTEKAYLNNVQTALKERMPEKDFTNLDFSRSVLSKVDSVSLYLLRVPFQGKALRNDFVLVKTDKTGWVEQGKIIHLEGKAKKWEEGIMKKLRFDGNITIFSLDKETVLHSPITNGYIEAFHGNNQRTASLMPSGETLPEVVVVGYIDNDNTLSYTDLCYLEKLLSSSGGSGNYSGGYYGSLDGNISDGGGGYSGGSGSSDYYDYGGVVQDPPILIDFENQDGLDAIDVQKYFNCFLGIPDAGSTCSIEIFTDVPVDTDPNILFDFNNGSPGHTFIQIKKSNGLQSTIQNIGFYPKSGWKVKLTNAPTEGKFVDNSQHEFNASLRMNISPENLRSILTEILYLANFIQYDIDNYNCTDFALDIFNKVRTNKIEIDLYDIPGNYPSTGTRTPQGLYKKLRQMKDSNHPEAYNISMSNFKCWVANSSGPCN